jgi:hypothetical protein
MGDSGTHFVQLQCAQMIGNQRRSARFAVSKFRVLVNVTAPLDNLWLDGRHGLINARLGRCFGQNLGRDAKHPQCACECHWPELLNAVHIVFPFAAIAG